MTGPALHLGVALLALVASGWLRLLAVSIRGLDPETLAWPAAARAATPADPEDEADLEAPIRGVLARFVRAARDLEAGAVIMLAVAAIALAPFLGGGLRAAAILVGAAVLAALVGVFWPERLAAGREARILGRATPAVLALAGVFHPLARAADLIVTPLVPHGAPSGAPEFGVPAVDARPPAPGPVAGGAPEPPAATGLREVLAFVAATVHEVMTPRTEVVGVESGSTVGDLARIVRSTRRGIYPVYGLSLDDVGVTVSVADLLGVPASDYVDLHARPADVVPESKRVADLVAEMRAEGSSFVLVVDEFGALAGVANLHDLIGELVGEVAADAERAEFECNRIDADTWVLDPFLKIERVNELVGLALPEGDYQTLSGYILYVLGRIPRPHDHVPLPEGDLEILAADERRIHSVRFRRGRDGRWRALAARRG
jgi:CBS domain containing-hemolysin-like protein